MKPTDIETLIEAYDQEELPALLKASSDEQLKEWEPLLDKEYDRLGAVLEGPYSALLGD